MSDSATVEAITDLARILVAFNPEITSKSEAIRRLHMASMKPARIATLLAMPTKDVTSVISRISKTPAPKKAQGGGKDKQRA